MTSTNPVTEQTLRVPGAEIAYALAGAGPVLLLIPGGASDAVIFWPVVDPLSAGGTSATIVAGSPELARAVGGRVAGRFFDHGHDRRGDRAFTVVGVLVETITADSAYAEAGGQINDVIVELDGTQVRTIDTLLARVRRYRAGDIVPVRILRADTEATFDVTMGLLNP